MYGEGGEGKKNKELGRKKKWRRWRKRHMLSEDSSVVEAGDSCSAPVSSSACYFSKDVRKINVGDCALFKPPHDSPPFVGIIRSLASADENLKLEVNWLYRPGEVKLGKGVALEAAPNEVFYSFHRDEIPAASLLHPCKVSFLPKGVELPSGLSSFVCRRVYDITNKCLWWLTDRDYIDNRQEEVDTLLNKTRFDMHATMQQQQQGGRSPKPMNGQMSTSQLKNSPESMQTGTGSFSSQSKGKKRDRSDQGSEPSKRDRATRSDDGDVGHLKAESLLKSEIGRITERGGLVNFEGVERLVQLMQCEKQDRKTDWASRSLLAAVIAATDRFDCLSRFVQLRGLVVLDEWLQEVHKSRTGDSSSPKDTDRSVDEFLLVLLRALDKLPVNLNALQTCNIGKSVNHLRSHRNSEIQKKARSLVDTWKKRVEAEMNISDTKSGPGQTVPWTARSQSGNRQTGGPSDAVMRSSLTQLSSPKAAPGKLIQQESNGKSSAATSGSSKTSLPASPSANSRDGQPRMSVGGPVTDLPLVAARDEKSSSSSQSHTNSQCSSEHGKNQVPYGKEDARSSTAWSKGISKNSGSASRHRRSPNGLQEASGCVTQREGGSSRNFVPAKIFPSEKSSQSPITVDKTSDAPAGEGNHKLIVKIPNRSRSPAQNIVGGTTEDPSIANSRASSPVDSEKHGQPILSSNNPKDGASHEGDGSPAVAPDCDRYQTGDNLPKQPDSPKQGSASPGHELRPRKLVEASFSSINALIEASDNALIRDDVGMNLLASVAAGEISKSGIAMPTGSPSNTTDEPNYNGSSRENEGDLKRHFNVSGKELAQKENSSRRSGGKSDDLVGAASLLTFEKASGGEEYHEKKTSLNDVGALERKDGYDGSITKQETREATTEVSSSCVETKDDDEKRQANQGMNNITCGEGMPSASMMKNEDASITSGAIKHAPNESLNGMKLEDTVIDSVDGCGRVDKGGKECNDRENIASETPPKVEDSHRGLAVSGTKNIRIAENTNSKEAFGNDPGGPSSQKDSIVRATEESTVNLKGAKSEVVEGPVLEEQVSTSGSSDTDGTLGFDLNEGFNVDDSKCIEPAMMAPPGFSASRLLLGPMPAFPLPSTSTALPTSVTVAAAAKGPFVPPEDLLKIKGELGWKGSAATSAFRPAEPRRVSEVPLGTGSTQVNDASISKSTRVPLEFDLNVADDRIFEDMGCQNSTSGKSDSMSGGILISGQMAATTSYRNSGGLDLDLNKVDEVPELGHQSNSHRFEVPFPAARLSLSSGVSNNETSSRRNFDLNNGPAVDEAVASSSFFNQGRVNFPMQPPIRINNIDIGSLSSWYPPGNSYSAIPMPSLLPDRGEQPFPVLGANGIGAGGPPQRIVGGPTGSTPFHPDAYRGTVLSSSAAMPFPSTPFQYPVFPFGTSFPLPSSTFPGGSAAYMDLSTGGRLCIPAVPSQLIGTATAVSSQFPRPYVVTLPDNSNPAVDVSRKFGRQGLDLNAGPGVPDVEGRDETVPILSRQVPSSNPVSLTEEQARVYHVAGSVLKRKEPDGGWDGDRLSFKQAPWK